MSDTVFQVREYQTQLLNQVENNCLNHKNSLIELDCGLGKRFLQYSLLFDKFKNNKIILILQARTSLYETYEYFKNINKNEEFAIIDSRYSSRQRLQLMKTNRIILCLPQTLQNTMKLDSTIIEDFHMVLINEVDQIIRRIGQNQVLKHPYQKLLSAFENMIIIGMSGTLRDNHYVMNDDQIKIKLELESLCNLINNVEFLPMENLENTDLNEYISFSDIVPVPIEDKNIERVSEQLELMIQQAKLLVLEEIKKYDIKYYHDAKRDVSMLFTPLPIDEKLLQKFYQGYMTRKYLWSMSGKKSRIHTLRYGMSKSLVFNYLLDLPRKFLAVKQLAEQVTRTVVLCSYLDTVSELNQLLIKSGFETVQITGQTSGSNRINELNKFRKADKKTVAILSNVGERDIDLPEAEQLIIFDLIRTPKTVYQKLKRSRGGKCVILYYENTEEMKKVNSVLENIDRRYNWSTRILAPQKITN